MTTETSDIPTTLRDEENTFLGALIVLAVLASLLTQSALIPRFTAYLVTLSVYLILGAIIGWRLIRDGGDRIYVHSRAAYAAFGAIAFVLLVHLVITPTLGTLQRVPIFILVGVLNLFCIPLFITPARLFRPLATVTVGLVLVGLPTLVLGPISLGPLSVPTWRATAQLPVLGTFNHVTSVLRNPNTLGFLGAMSVIYFLPNVRDSWRARCGVGVCGLGVIVSMSRAAATIVAVGVALYTVAWIAPRYVHPLSVGEVIVAIVGLGAVFAFVPSLLNGREVLWPATTTAISHQPLIGYGPDAGITEMSQYITDDSQLGQGPHNSYLRIGLMGGITSLLGYCGLFAGGWTTLGTRLTCETAPDPEDLFVYVLFVAIIIYQLVAGMTVFGISGTSVIAALVLGFALTPTEKWGYYTRSRQKQRMTNPTSWDDPRQSWTRALVVGVGIIIAGWYMAWLGAIGLVGTDTLLTTLRGLTDGFVQTPADIGYLVFAINFLVFIPAVSLVIDAAARSHDAP